MIPRDDPARLPPPAVRGRRSALRISWWGEMKRRTEGAWGPRPSPPMSVRTHEGSKMKKVHSFQGLLTASCLVLLALEINRPASGATVTATVVTIGVDNKTTGPIGIPGPTFGRAYALLTPGIIPIPIPFNDPAGASTGTFRAITPATPAVAGAPALGLGSEASVSFPAAGTKVLNADAFIIGVSPFAGAQAKEPHPVRAALVRHLGHGIDPAELAPSPERSDSLRRSASGLLVGEQPDQPVDLVRPRYHREFRR